MARIRKDEYPRVLHLVDVERRPVREVAADYGCTAATIYGILAKCRRAADGTALAEETAAAADLLPAAAPALPGLSLDEAGPPAERLVTPAQATTPPPPAPRAVPAAVSPPAVSLAAPAAAEPAAPPVPVIPLARAEKSAPREAPLGARLARPGMGLVMRAEDGEETVTPFRSLDDLLSAIKPILRATARSPEPIWFSLRSVDLSAVEMDAA